MEVCEQGADKDDAGPRGDTPLHLATLKGHLDVVRCLCEQGADTDKFNQPGYTPLHMSAAKGHLEVVRYESSNDAVGLVARLIVVRLVRPQVNCVIPRARRPRACRHPRR